MEMFQKHPNFSLHAFEVLLRLLLLWALGLTVYDVEGTDHVPHLLSTLTPLKIKDYAQSMMIA